MGHPVELSGGTIRSLVSCTGLMKLETGLTMLTDHLYICFADTISYSCNFFGHKLVHHRGTSYKFPLPRFKLEILDDLYI